MLDLIAWRSRKSPGKPALFFNGRWYSYLELNARANQLANRLLDHGIKKGDRVGIIALNHPAHFDLIFAAAKIGFIYTPFNYRLTTAELAALSGQVRPSLVFADSRHLDAAQSLGVPWTRLSDYRSWLSAGSTEPPPPPTQELLPEDPHMILFTGGTTGVPKGAVLPYRQTLLNARVTAEAWALTDADTTIQCTPCFHAAVNALALPMFYKAGRVVLMSKFDPDEVLGHIALHKVTHLFMVPSMYQALVQHHDFSEANFSSLRSALSGGAPCPERIREQLATYGVRLVQGYGMTEAGVNCFTTGMESPDVPFGSLGVPMQNMEARIVDEDGRRCEPGNSGELQLKGPMLFSGYWQQPAETAAAMKDGWLSTGDIASADERGRYRILGRRKELYITGGEKVFPQEVEAALERLPDIAECAVLGVPDAHWGEQGLAAIVTTHGKPIEEAALIASLRAMLAPYKVPKHYYFMRGLPRSGAGKVLKAEILKAYELAKPEHHLARSLSRYP